MVAARPTGTPGAQGSGGTPGGGNDMAAAIAKSLGLTTAKVQAALQAVMPSGGAGGGGAPPSGGTPPSGASTTAPATTSS